MLAKDTDIITVEVAFVNIDFFLFFFGFCFTNLCRLLS